MDQHRDPLGTHGRQTDRQTDTTQLEENLAEMHRTIDRLHALQVEYRTLIQRTRENIRYPKYLGKRLTPELYAREWIS